MKILYCITQGEQGGGQKYVLDLAREMQKKGHDVYVAIGEIENEGDKWLFSTLKAEPGFKDLKDDRRFFEVKSHQREIKIWRDLKSVFEFVKLFRKIKPDVVHLNSSKAGVVGSLAGFLTGTKTVYTVHGFVFLEPMNFIKKLIYTFLEFFSARLRNFTILISQRDIKAGKKFRVLGNHQNYKLIYNGLDESLREKMLDKTSAREYIFNKIAIKDEGQKIIGTIANLFKTKGLEYFIDAVKQIVGAKAHSSGESLGGAFFVVMGTGPEEYRQELQDRINKNNLQNNFFLLGRTPNAFQYLKGLDLFVLTSVKEGLPYSILEAKLAGLPVVATRVGGIPEIAEHVQVNLAEVENSQDIAGKIIDEVKKQQNKYDFPDIFKLQRMVQETEKVYLLLQKENPRLNY